MKTLSIILLVAIIAANIECQFRSPIDSFKEINQHLDSTNTINWYNLAGIELVVTQNFIDTVQKLKRKIIESSGGWIDKNGKRHTDGNWSNNLGTLYNDANLKSSTKLMVEQGNGKMLYHLIQDTRNQFLHLIVDSIDRSNLSQQIPLGIPVGPKIITDSTWTARNFEQVPVIAVLTLFSKFESDAINSEHILKHYFEEKLHHEFPDSLKSEKRK
ncbi:MAG: hypothetical protein LH473_06535 [Chitinophagales bacterium]|nr:hypothetical protein [Chitinophagales bacterium]